MGASKHKTPEEILRVAMELFLARGVQQTSMQDVAGALGVTKPALYYHFRSRHDLVTRLLQPMMQSTEELLTDLESRDAHDPEEVLGALFDVQYEFRVAGIILLRELSVLSDVVDAETIVGNRSRVKALLVGPEPSLEAEVAAEVALGGLAECVLSHVEVDAVALKGPTVRAACAALGWSDDS